MKRVPSSVVAVTLVLAACTGLLAQAQAEITLLAVGPMRAPTQKIVDAFQTQTGRTVKVTYGNGATPMPPPTITTDAGVIRCRPPV